MLQALREVEAGRLSKLMNRLVNEGAEFEGLMNSAQSLMTTLGEGSATLLQVAARLDAAQGAKPEMEYQAALDDLFAPYTMERERDVHREFLRRFGLVSATAARRIEVSEAVDDGIELF